MANGFGYTFSPSGRNRIREQNGEQGAPAGSRNLGRALQVLSLRLPNITGGSPIAPDELLRSMGGPGPGAGPAPVGLPQPPSSPMTPTPPGGSQPIDTVLQPQLVDPPGVPPLMSPPPAVGGGSTAPLQQLVAKATKGTAPSPIKKKTTSSGRNPVRGGIPSLATSQSAGTPRIIPGIDQTSGGSAMPTVFPNEQGMMETSGIPQLQNAPKPRWADKYAMDPSMFNSFLG